MHGLTSVCCAKFKSACSSKVEVGTSLRHGTHEVRAVEPSLRHGTGGVPAV